MKSLFWQGFWRLADPKISLASVSSMFLGACVAFKDGGVDWFWLAVTFVGVFAIEVAKNASGEVFDYQSGADSGVAVEDRSPFSGGKRVLVDRLLSVRQTVCLAGSFYAAGIAFAVLILWRREASVLWLVMTGALCAYFYHAPPLKLSYRGWGEPAVFLCYGPLLCGGTYLVQRLEMSGEVFWVAVPLGFLIAAFLWINEFPDYRGDREAGKRTWVVRLGRQRARRIFVALILAALFLVCVLPLLEVTKGVWGGLLFGPPAGIASWRLWKNPEKTASIVPAQGLMILSFLLYALGAGVGMVAFSERF